MKLPTIVTGLTQLRKRLFRLDKRLDRIAKSMHICTSYELYGRKDEGRQLMLGHAPNLDWHDRHD